MQPQETFFTVIGCMDGRVQEIVTQFGQRTFGAQYPDTITEAGIVGILANNPSQEFLEGFKKKVMISLEKHHSVGIIVDGHAECAGDPVDDIMQHDHIRKSVTVIQKLINNTVPVRGVFVKRDRTDWHIIEVPLTAIA